MSLFAAFFNPHSSLSFILAVVFAFVVAQSAQAGYWDWVGKGVGETSYFDDCGTPVSKKTNGSWYLSLNKGEKANFANFNHNFANNGSGGRPFYNSGWNKVVTFRTLTSLMGVISFDAHDDPITFVAEDGAYGVKSTNLLKLNSGAELVIDSGTYSFGYILLGNGSSNTGVGVLTMNGGTLNILDDYVRLGCAGGTGILTVKKDAVFNNCDATENGKNFTLGQESKSSGTLNVQGGIVKIGGFIALNYNADSNESRVNVTEGGTLEVSYLYLNHPGTSGGALTIDGGTLKARADSSSFISAHDYFNVYVGSNGATFDTAGHAITVAENLQSADETAGDLTVTGGGAAMFFAMGDLTGALTVGDNTTLRWFDQDGKLSATCGFTSLALGAGSTVYLNGDATGVDALPTTVTTTATVENKANIVIEFSAIPATGTSFTLFPAASADVFNVSPMVGSLALPNEVAVVDGNLVLTIVAEDYTWNGSQTNWGDADAWTKGGAAATWSDGNNAIFNTANATATLAADASPAKIDFTAAATVDGTFTLTVPVVSVAPGVSATISAPTAGALSKTGAGTLVLGSSRTGETTVSEGTLKMANGATVAPANLTLGTDPTKPVVFDYAGQTLVATLTTFVKPGANVTLTNIVVSNITEKIYFAKDSAPSVLTVAKGAVLDFGKHYMLNTDNEATFNIAGGTAKTKANEDNWIMQASLTGRLNINVTNGGLMEFGGEVYALTCRNAVNGSTDYENPSLYWSIVDSTLRVKNGKSVRFGHDAQNKNPKCPTGVFAATNSVIDVPYYITIGSDVAGENKAGSYTADFEDCIITAKALRVFYDRPLNAIRLNNTRFVLPGDYDNWLYSSPEFETIGEGETAIKPITIDADGLILDTKGFNGNINSDPQGPGPITKVGKGILRIIQNQTSTSPLVCAEGETYVSDGLSVARAITVKSGAKLTTKGIRQVALADIAFEDGAELRVDGYDSGVVPIAVTTLTLPASGTVSLTKNNNFSKGKYRILEKAGITVEDVQDRLVPATTGNLAYSWSVEGNTLYLTVGEPMGFSWTGFAGDGKMSTPGNWLGGIAPGADDPVDFSSVDTAITVDADIDATLGAVTMGGGVVTFTGSLTATSFTDNSKIAVGANSTVTLDGNLEFTSGVSYITYKVGDGGAFVVTGTIKATGTANVLPYATASSGWIIAKGLENAETEGGKWNFRLNYENVAKWVVGEDGFSGAQYFWSFNDVNSDTTIKADADFTIATWLSAGSLKGKGITIDTSGWTDPNADYTITANCGFTGIKPLTIKGGGTFICNYTPQKIDGSNGPAFSGAVTVTDAATLAINAGKKVTSGAITIDEGAALIAKGAGVVDLSGNNVALKSNAKFGFEFERFSTAPQFKFGEGKFSFPEFESTNVVLKISGIYPSSSPFVLTSGYDFRNVTSVTLAEDSPKWVKCIYVDDDGNIVLLAKPIGTRIIVR